MTDDREPVDVADKLMDWLGSELADRFPELDVRLDLPGDWSLGSGPVLLVEDDGDPMKMWPAATSPTIRITSWTSGRERKYVNAALPLLLTKRIPGITAVKPGAGILDARDSKTGGDLSSFTVRARARTAVPQQ